MEKRDYLIYGILVVAMISIILNFAIMGKFEEVNRQNQQLQDEIGNVRYEVSNLSNQLYEINKDNNWIVNQDFIADKELSSPDEIHLNVEWTFSEVESNSKVMVIYRAEGKEEWNEVSATNTFGLTYKAPLKLSPDERYEYQIISQGDTNKSAETQGIPLELYTPMPLLSSSSSSATGPDGKVTQYSMEFEQIQTPILEFFTPKSVKAIIHYEDKLTEEINLQKLTAQDRTTWRLELGPLDTAITTIDLRVEYGDGTVHEGEIYPDEEEYMRSIEFKYKD